MSDTIAHNIVVPDDALREFAVRWGVGSLALFGSVLRDDFGAESDIDVLVTFVPDCGYSLFDLAQIQEELKAILHHEVDVVEKAGLRNPFRKYRSVL